MTSSDWPQLHAWLRQDPDNPQTWLLLDDQVRHLILQHFPDLDLNATQDAVEKICIQVVADLGKGLGPETFQGFVYGQFLTVSRRMLARAKAERSEAPTEGPHTPSPLEEDPGELALALVAQCLSALPQMHRRAIELRYFQQTLPAEIAITLVVSEENARCIVFNGLTHLRKCMGARGA
jgi:DNA-directed RNA polymerase specialized sigma24 family protein